MDDVVYHKINYQGSSKVIKRLCEESNNLVDNKAEKSDIPVNTSDLVNDSGFIDDSVNTLQHYYDRDAINNMLSSLPGKTYIIVDSLPVILEYDASFYFMMGMDYGSTKAYGTAIIMPSYDESEIYYELGGVELPASVDISDYTAFEYASTFPEPGSQDETKIFTIAYTEFDREGNPTGNYIVEMDIFYTADGRQRIIEVGRTKGWTPTEPFVDLEDAQYYAQTFLPSEITIRSVEGYPPAKEGVMYLVPNQESETGNLYDEFMVVRYYDSSENVWVKQYEKIGAMSADLANYYTKAETNALLAGKADTTDIPDELSDLQDDSTHRLVTDTEKSTWNGKSVVTANPQATTGTLTSIAINGTAYAIPTGTQGTVTSVNNVTPDQNGNVTLDANDVGALPDDTPLFSGDYNDLTNKPTIPDELADLQDDTTHRVVTDTEKMTWNNKSDFSGSYNDLTNKPTIPDELADLSDDSTHRLVTDTEKTTWNNKSDFSGSYNDLTDKPTIPAAQIQSDWDQNDSTALDYIKNKPTIPSVPVQSVNGQTGVVVLDADDVGALPDDTPLFSGDYNDLTNKPTIPDELADLQDDTTHRLVTDTEKSTWNGKSDFSGSYNDLTDKPTIPAAQIQSDWDQNDSTALDYIKNKPTIPSVPVTSVNGQTGAVVLDANDVGALPDDTPLLEPLIGTTLTLTPTQVSTAIQAGSPVVVSYTDSTYGTFIFDSFAVSSGMLIGSQTACIHSGSTSTNMVVVLSADTTNDTWEFHPPTILARRSDIPDELADLQDDATHRLVTDTEKSTWNGKSTVTANPASTTEMLASIEINGVGYAVSGGSTSLADAWRVKGGTALTASQESPIDLNTYLTSGTYYMNTDAQVEFVANKPALAQSKRFTLIVQRVGNSSATIKQIFIGGYDNKVFWRFTRNTGSVWFAWEEMAYADKMWRLASGIQLDPTTENHVDLDTLISAGTYFITSDIANYVDNKPTTSSNRFTLIVQAIGNADENRIKQIYIPRGTQASYIRYKDGSTATWSSWKETAFVDAIPTALSQLTDDSTHRLVTDTEKAGWDAKSDFSGSYNDLTDKPTIPAAQVNSDWNASSGIAKILNKPTLSAVATSGSYNDLTDKPTIPTDYVKTSNAGVQTIDTTSGNTALALIGGANNSYLEFRNNSSSLGSIGILSNGAPVFNNGADNRIFCDKDGWVWQLGSGIAITATAEEHADLNTFTTLGTYYLSSNTAGNVDNRPVTNGYRFTLIVQRIGNNSSCIRQIYMTYSNAVFYVRATSNGGSTWTAWTYLALGTHLDSYVKLSDGALQTIINSSSGTRVALALRSAADSGTLLGFQNSAGTTLGFLGVNSSNKPIFRTGSSDTELALKTDVIERLAWWKQTDTHSADTDVLSGVTFGYTAHGLPVNGTFATFAGKDVDGNNTRYRWQLLSNYKTNELYVRSRNGDAGTWSAWKQLLTDGSFLPTTGGQMTGAITFAQGSIAQQTANTMPFFLGIDAFASGGAMKWQTTAGVVNALNAGASGLVKKTTNIQSGTVTISAIGTATTLTFGTAFGGVPKLSLTPVGSSLASVCAYASSVTASGATVFCNKTCTLHWIAYYAG